MESWLTIQNGFAEKKLAHGYHISAKMVRGIEIDESITPSDTEFHEACHLRAALLDGTGVSHATNIRTSEYQGATFTHGFSAVVAAAAESQGCVGTGHDLMQIRTRGENPGSAVSAARSLLAGRKHELMAIATLIKKQNVITGSEGQRVAEEARLGIVLEIVTTNPEGKSTTRLLSVRNGEHDVLVAADLPKEFRNSYSL